MNVNPDANFKMIDLLMENFDEMDMSHGNFSISHSLSAKFLKGSKNEHAEACKDNREIIIRTEALQRKFLKRGHASRGVVTEFNKIVVVATFFHTIIYGKAFVWRTSLKEK